MLLLLLLLLLRLLLFLPVAPTRSRGHPQIVKFHFSVLGLLERAISPSQVRYLTQTQNKHKQTAQSLRWHWKIELSSKNSNFHFQSLSHWAVRRDIANEWIFYYNYGYAAVCWALAAFPVSWSYTQSVGLLGQVISPLQGRYLHTEQHTHRKNAHNRHSCLEWDSNSRSQRSSNRRHFMP
jgi:hypothetical protein